MAKKKLYELMFGYPVCQNIPLKAITNPKTIKQHFKRHLDSDKTLKLFVVDFSTEEKFFFGKFYNF